MNGMTDTFSYSENLLRCAKDALQKPEDFGYWGPEDTFVTWGFCGIDKTRDSSIIDISNFDTMSKTLMSEYPNDFRIETYSHWLVGSIDRLVCRVLKNGTEITQSNITNAFTRAMICKDQLNDYPVYNEDDYSNKLHKAAIDSLNDLPLYLEKMIDTNVPDYAEKIYHEMVVNMDVEFDVDSEQYPTDDEILSAVYCLQIWNPEEIEEWEYWTDRNGLERIPFKKENPNQLKLFED